MAVIKPSGPSGAVRPFTPGLGIEEPAERIAHALEHIAVSLAALDQSLEALLARIASSQR